MDVGKCGMDESVAVGAGGGLWEPREILLIAALTLRPCLAIAIQGQNVGRAVLDDEMFASFFFLCERIFGTVYAATRSPGQPSGFVPGWESRT
jgi:hypothetical protein